MIRMRDGVKLYTVIFSPVGAKNPLPVLLQRTPYGADPGFANDSALSLSLFGNNYGSMMREGYFLVFQDIRGKYKSEGKMEIHQPLIHATKKGPWTKALIHGIPWTGWLKIFLGITARLAFLAFLIPAGWHWLVL